MSNADTQPIDSRPRTLKELAAYYEVDIRTMKKWLTMSGVSRTAGTYYYSIQQIHQFCEKFGRPDE